MIKLYGKKLKKTLLEQEQNYHFLFHQHKYKINFLFILEHNVEENVDYKMILNIVIMMY